MNITPFDPKKDVVIPLPDITARLHAVVSEQYAHILLTKKQMEETTGEMRDAYTLVLKNQIWKLTTEYFKVQNELVAQTVQLEVANDNGVKSLESQFTANCESISDT